MLKIRRSRDHLILNTLRPRPNSRQFPDDIFKCMFLNENILISIKTPQKFIPRFLINNIPALVQIMDWRRSGDKPLLPMRRDPVYGYAQMEKLMWKYVAANYHIFRVVVLPSNTFKYILRFITPLHIEMHSDMLRKNLSMLCNNW